jgi:hypothetical protein
VSAIAIKAVLFDGAGVAWAEVLQTPDQIPAMMRVDDIGWARGLSRHADDGSPLLLVDLGSFDVDPDTREITFAA